MRKLDLEQLAQALNTHMQELCVDTLDVDCVTSFISACNVEKLLVARIIELNNEE